MPTFTYDETEILCMCTGETREERITCLQKMKKYLPAEVPELIALTNRIIAKLTRMTDTDFAVLKNTLIPDYEE